MEFAIVIFLVVLAILVVVVRIRNNLHSPHCTHCPIADNDCCQPDRSSKTEQDSQGANKRSSDETMCDYHH